ncbi:hypothetical protein HMPREF1624_04096 [Sporothrix schenckii ATCC 58251]|uniref:Pre-mRNA-splicing factor CWC26 n=1 Tax=Sporothrix schenckii (strain ATCC 58251 / de Perez 2211183) TaxID=1391915 RepID=U7PW14_SPOS1|nr:hypothetical protein HMPREF1624_04096 [Sporothrix schenckii ATCC 58251]
MPADLTSYLASRYLVADTKPTKKRKRKHNKDGGDGLLITDDDDSGWAKKGGRGGGSDDDADEPTIAGGGTVAGTSAAFRKTKKSNWTVLGSTPKSNTNTPSAGETTADTAADTDADAIIAAAAADTAAALAAEDEAPVVEGEDGTATPRASAVLMSDGTHAGLQSAASVTAQLERRRREEREQYERERREKRERRRQRGGGDKGGLSGEEEEDVVYRDATGRRVDVALRRQEARQAALEAEQKERDAKEALRGDVQRDQARQRREELADAALMPLARGADDEAMNRELKAQTRWNDPMAAFLAEKTPAAAASGGGSGGGGGSASTAAKSGRPVYRGPAAPNRYGIRPGYRWDGVDRGIGFEAERFKAINRRERDRDLNYQWQMDV